ncbi:MAG: indole-3-glycerol phosphate synthase TrpC [Acidobacteriota bacterium]
MHGFLEQVIARRRERVQKARALVPYDHLAARLPERAGRPSSPVGRIVRSCGFIIAEIKRASPSRGRITAHADVVERALAYERGGADAISVLCEPDYFCGSSEDVAAVARSVRVPVLCKDFVVDPYQLVQARHDGASWVLLIARVLGEALGAYVERALDLGLEPLVEVHSEPELRHAVASGARVIGINSRDLDTFHVDFDTVKTLAPLVPPGSATIAESGIRDEADLRALADAGAHGFLIGEALMRSSDPESMLRGFGRALGRAEVAVLQ